MKTPWSASFGTSAASDWSHMPVGRQAGGDLTAELCIFDNFCLLALLRAVCTVPECSVFWHHGVPRVGVLANRAPRGSSSHSCWTVVEGGGCLMRRTAASFAAVCVGQKPSSKTEASFMTRKKKTLGVCLQVIGFPSICSVWSFIKQDFSVKIHLPFGLNAGVVLQRVTNYLMSMIHTVLARRNLCCCRYGSILKWNIKTWQWNPPWLELKQLKSHQTWMLSRRLTSKVSLMLTSKPSFSHTQAIS